MYISKQEKNICILLITFILLLGMCFDNIQTDSFLSYAASDEHSAQTAPTLNDSHNVTFNQLYAEAVLSRQLSTNLQKQRRSCTFFLMYILPLLLSSVIISVAYKFLPDICNASVIIRYIHHKDGKKSKLSF